jgi:hypothetical protein
MSLSFFRKKKVTKENLPAGKSSLMDLCFGRDGGCRRFPMLVFRKVIKGLVRQFRNRSASHYFFLDEKVTKNQDEKKASARPAFQIFARKRFETAFPPALASAAMSGLTLVKQ